MKGLIFVMLFSVFGCCQGDPKTIVMEERAEVFEAAEPNPDAHYRKPLKEKNRVISIVESGETVEFICVEYKKDYAAYKVRLKDGRKGFVMSGARFRDAENTRTPSR